MSNDAQLSDLAAKHGFSIEAVRQMQSAMRASGGGMAQFSHPEFGGFGQWMRGGMLMIGDMFNHSLKARVDALCHDLSALPVTSDPGQTGGLKEATASHDWWPSGLGMPGSTGGQNDFSYAYFPAAHRLAVRHQGTVKVYDTAEHSIGGFSQQQGTGFQGFFFSSQNGMFPLTSLREV